MFNINDIIVLCSALISMILIILSTPKGEKVTTAKVLKVKPQVKIPVTTITETKPKITVENLLSLKLMNLVGGYPEIQGKVFETYLPPAIAPRGFEGSWKCVKLGCGGWGCTYKCEDSKGRVVVFKVPRGLEGIIEEQITPTIPEKTIRRVTEEAEILSKLSHPHILRLLGYSTKAPILVYEFADYGSLEWQIVRGWKPSLKDVLLIGIQVGDALRYIHSRGLVHGDVKASNIFIVDGVVKVGDFSSLVKLLSQTSAHSRFAYTPGWRAPEQVFSDLKAKAIERGLENRIDVYQLANSILYLLTGETIDGEDAVNRQRVESLLSRIENEELRGILREMFKTNPWERPTIDEVVRKLTEIYAKV